jgi:hypothetical protein
MPRIKDKKTGEVFHIQWKGTAPPTQDELAKLVDSERLRKQTSRPVGQLTPQHTGAIIKQHTFDDALRNAFDDIKHGEFSEAVGDITDQVPNAIKEGGRAFLRSTIGDPWGVHMDSDEPENVGGIAGALGGLINDPLETVRSIFPSGTMPGEERPTPTGSQREYEKMFAAPTIPEKVGRAITGSVPFVGPAVGGVADEFQETYPNEPLLDRISRGVGGTAGAVIDTFIPRKLKGAHGGDITIPHRLEEGFLEHVDPVTGRTTFRRPDWNPESRLAPAAPDPVAPVADVPPRSMVPEEPLIRTGEQPVDAYDVVEEIGPPVEPRAPARAFASDTPRFPPEQIPEPVAPQIPESTALSIPEKPIFAQALAREMEDLSPTVSAPEPNIVDAEVVRDVAPMAELDSGGGAPGQLPPVPPMDALPPGNSAPKPPADAGIRGGPSRAERALFSVRRNLAKIPEVGPKLAEMVGKYEDMHRSQASNAIALRRHLTDGMNPAQQRNLVDVLDGQGMPMDPTVAQAAKILRAKMDEMANLAAQNDVLINYREDYFPHRYADDTWDYEAPRPLESQDFGNRKDPNLERPRRSNRTDYRRDVNVLDEYFHDAYRRISESQHLGKHLQKVLDSNISLQPEIKQYVEKTMERLTGREPHTVVTRTLDKARHLQALSDLGLAAPLQLGQLPFTAAEGGIRRSVRAAGELARNYRGEMLKAIKSGALWPNISHEVSSAAGGGRGFLWGVPTMDRVMRVHANTVARLLVEDAMNGNAAALKQLKKMGFEAPPSAGLAGPGELQAISQYVDKVGSTFTDKTNFRTGVLDLPLWSTSPAGKLAAQYSQFSYRATKAVTDVMKEASKGNVKPLAKLLATGVITGELIADARALVRGQDTALVDTLEGGKDYSEEEWKDVLRQRRLSDPDKRILQNLLSIGVGGMFTKGYEVATDWRQSKALLGPVPNTAMDAYDSVRESVDDESVEPIVEFGLEQVPVYGHELARRRKDSRKFQ